MLKKRNAIFALAAILLSLGSVHAEETKMSPYELADLIRNAAVGEYPDQIVADPVYVVAVEETADGTLVELTARERALMGAPATELSSDGQTMPHLGGIAPQSTRLYCLLSKKDATGIVGMARFRYSSAGLRIGKIETDPGMFGGRIVRNYAKVGVLLNCRAKAPRMAPSLLSGGRSASRGGDLELCRAMAAIEALGLPPERQEVAAQRCAKLVGLFDSSLYQMSRPDSRTACRWFIRDILEIRGNDALVDSCAGKK